MNSLDIKLHMNAYNLFQLKTGSGEECLRFWSRPILNRIKL